MTFWPCGSTEIINVVQIKKALCCGFKRNNKILEPYIRTLIYMHSKCTPETRAVIHIVAHATPDDPLICGDDLMDDKAKTTTTGNLPSSWSGRIFPFPMFFFLS